MKKLILIIVCFCATLLLHAAVLKTVSVAAGGLSAALTATEIANVTDLTVNGSIDARDVKFMRDRMNSLSVLNLSGASIIAYTGTNGTVSASTTYLVNEMPKYSFYNSTYAGKATLTSITLPNSLTSIGVGAFKSCTALTSPSIPSTVISIGSYAFFGCNALRSVTIANSVTSIGSFAYGCSGITSVSIPNSITLIDKWVFSNCTGLTSIAIPNTVTSIGDYAFYGCNGLMSLTIPSAVNSIGESAFYNCAGLTTITIPNSITSIKASTFSKCSGLTSIIIPSSVTSISDLAFSDCNKLTNFTIPNSVTTIGKSAFYNCTGITSVSIPNSVTTIDDEAFLNCSGLTTVVVPNSISSIKNSTFSNCTGLRSISIPSSVNAIEDFAFFDCYGLPSISLPNSVTSLGSYAFSNCTGLSTITLSNTLTSIGDHTFSASGLTNITIPSSVKSIVNWAFSECSKLTNITIPNSVTSIGSGAFYFCSGLTSVKIGNSVASMGDLTFLDCQKLSSIYSYTTKPIVLSSGVFTNVNKNTCKLYVPANTKTTYQATASWKDFTNIFEMSSTITQNIPLVSGWNILSSNVIPSDIDLKNIIQPLINKGKLIKVMDESGKAIENFAAFGGWSNGIGNFSQTEGYRINLTSADTLILNGTAVSLPLKISLNTGWNIISYPCTDAQSALIMVQPLINRGNLIKVMDESGKSIENFGGYGGWKNNIGSFNPGKGFKFYMANPDTLLITSNILRSAKAETFITNLESTYFKKVYEGNGTDHMNIYLVDLGTSTLQLGDEIGVFDGTACVGSATIGSDQMAQGSISIPTSCNDGVGDVRNGFIPGNEISYKLYSNGILYNMTMSNLSGSSTFEKSGSLFVKLESKVVSDNLPTIISDTEVPVEISCYPNPFVKEISIDVQYTLPTKLNVGIYNLMGQLIKIIYEGETDSIHLKWDGTDKKGNQVIPGIYLCKVNDSSKKIVFTRSK